MTKLYRARWIRFTEEINSLDYLEKAYTFIQKVQLEPRLWKWIIICLHGALYGFAISACRGTNFERVTYKTKKGKQKLVSLNEALKYCQDSKRMRMTILSRHLELTESQKESIRILKESFRDNFEHFIPKHWSIEIHGFPQITIDVLDVIKFLAIDTKNYCHLNISQCRRIKSIVFQSKRIVKNSILYKEYKIAKNDN